MTRSRPFRVVLGLVVAAVAFAWALPSFAPYRDVGQELSGLRGRPAALLVVLGAANLVAPALVHRSSVPGLRLHRAVAADWATSAATNTIPGGSALAVGMTWTMYRSWGIDRRAIARSVLVTGIWDNLVKFGTPLAALLWLASERPVATGLVEATVAGCVVLGLVVVLGSAVLLGQSRLEGLGEILDGLPILGEGWTERLDQLRADTRSLIRERWRALTLWTVLGHGNYYLLLLTCLRAVGVGSEQLTPAAVLAAFTFGRLVTALPLTPGGLGVLEVGLTGALTTVGSAPEAALVAAVLIFRFCTYFLPIPLGVVTWLAWSGRRPPAEIVPVDPSPTDAPDLQPTDAPDLQPTDAPDLQPTEDPDLQPTEDPDLPAAGDPDLPLTDGPDLPPGEPPPGDDRF